MFEFKGVFWWQDDPASIVPGLKNREPATLSVEQLKKLMENFAVMTHHSRELGGMILKLDCHRWHFRQR